MSVKQKKFYYKAISTKVLYIMLQFGHCSFLLTLKENNFDYLQFFSTLA